MSRVVVVLLIAVFHIAFGDRDCAGDVPLVIPSGKGSDSDLLTVYLYAFGLMNGLPPRTTITCPQLLANAPLLCDAWNMQLYCCQSCALLGPKCCVDQHITFGVINDTYNSAWVYNGELSGNDRWTGVVPAYLEALADVMGFNYTFVPVQYMNMVSGDLMQAGVIDAMLLQKRGTYFHKFTEGISTTEAIVEFDHDIVIRKGVTSGGIWKIFDPFTKELWGLVCAAILTAGAVFWLIEGRLDDDENRNRVHGGVLGSLYFATSTMLHGGGHDAMSWLGRCLRVGTLFFMLIVTSTYTAELAAILTVETREPDGPETLAAATAARICCVMGSDEPSCISDNWVEPDVGADPIEYCSEMLRSGEVDGIACDEFVYTTIAGDNCKDFIFSGVSFAPSILTLALSPRVQHLVKHFNSAIAKIKSDNLYGSIEEKYFPEPCTVIKEEETLVIDVRHMAGLFIILGSYCTAVLCLLATRLVFERSGVWEGRTMEEEICVEKEKAKDPYEGNDLTPLLQNQRRIIQTLEQITKERQR